MITLNWANFRGYCMDSLSVKGTIPLSNNWIIRVNDDYSEIRVCNNGDAWLTVIFGDLGGVHVYDDSAKCPGIYTCIWSELLSYGSKLNRHGNDAIKVIRDLMKEERK